MGITITYTRSTETRNLLHTTQAESDRRLHVFNEALKEMPDDFQARIHNSIEALASHIESKHVKKTRKDARYIATCTIAAAIFKSMDWERYRLI